VSLNFVEKIAGIDYINDLELTGGISNIIGRLGSSLLKELADSMSSGT
jgi:hypothetical protein